MYIQIRRDSSKLKDCNSAKRSEDATLDKSWPLAIECGRRPQGNKA